MISEKLKRVILEQLELEDWDIDDTTTAAMVPGWDSLSHAQIIAAVEDAYEIRFRMIDIMRLENVAQLQALVDSRTG
jgi:acyl carrier protein